MERGLFLVFEGGEGSGKTLQAKLLEQALARQGYSVLYTKEPGCDDELCKKIRKILLDPRLKGKVSLRAELLLFAADRAQHAERVMRPALQRGHIVLCDRFEASTFAYQCVARNICTIHQFDVINAYAALGTDPDFTFWLDIDPRVGLKRSQRSKKRDRLTLEDISFHEKVREGYGTYFEHSGEISKNQWRKFDATRPIQDIHNEILETTLQLLSE